MNWNLTVNNSDSEAEARSKAKLLKENMTVGRDWRVHVWPIRRRLPDGKCVISCWRHELRSASLRIQVYPTTSPDNGDARFAVDFFGGKMAVDVNVRWEKQTDPNKAVIELIKALERVVSKDMKFLDKVRIGAS